MTDEALPRWFGSEFPAKKKIVSRRSIKSSVRAGKPIRTKRSTNWLAAALVTPICAPMSEMSACLVRRIKTLTHSCSTSENCSLDDIINPQI